MHLSILLKAFLVDCWFVLLLLLKTNRLKFDLLFLEDVPPGARLCCSSEGFHEQFSSHIRVSKATIFSTLNAVFAWFIE